MTQRKSLEPPPFLEEHLEWPRKRVLQAVIAEQVAHEGFLRGQVSHADWKNAEQERATATWQLRRAMGKV